MPLRAQPLAPSLGVSSARKHDVRVQMKVCSGIAGAALVLFSLACSGSGSGSPSLSVSPTLLTVAAGSGATRFTATLTGASETVSWTLSGPGTISAASGLTTSYTPPASVGTATAATLRASAGSLTASANITVNPPPSIIVTGTLVTLNGEPIGSAGVTIGTQNAISDATGSFTVFGVAPPYTVVAVFNQTAVVYQGLTVTSPTIVFPNAVPAFQHSGVVSGNVTSTPVVGTAGYFTEVAWGSPETSIFQYSSQMTANPFTLTLGWNGPASTTGNLHVLQWAHDANGFPTSYSGYQVKQGVVVAASGTTGSQDMTTTGGVTSATLGGTVSLSAGSSLASNLLGMEFDDGASLLLGGDEVSPPSSFSWVTPSSIGGRLFVEAMTLDAAMDVTSYSVVSGLMANATGVSVMVPEGSKPAAPSASAAGITTATQFSWSAFAGGIHFVDFRPSAPANPEIYVFTSATTLSIPDLTAEGLALPPGGAAYSWQVFGVAPFATLDAFAGGNFLSPLAQTNGVLVLKPLAGFPVYRYSFSSPRAFTTQ